VLDKVDAVLLVLPHHLHHPVTLECLDAGKHVLVEKPMANSEQECLEMIESAKRNERVLMVAYCMRFHPLVLKMKELIDAKTYGDVFQLSIWTEQLTRYPVDHWASSAQTLGGGQLFSHGCHYIDLLLWMLGKPVWGTHFGTNTGTPWMEREGTSNVTIEFENGVMGYHMGTWGARGSRLKYSFHAHCTEGMIEADISHGRLIAHSKTVIHDPSNHNAAQAEEVLLEVPHAKPTEVEMAHFIECIRTGQKPLTDPVGSLEGLQVIWKLYEAEEQRRLADLRGMGIGSLKL
jgi:predicted dehydrogenase